MVGPSPSSTPTPTAAATLTSTPLSPFGFVLNPVGVIAKEEEASLDDLDCTSRHSGNEAKVHHPQQQPQPQPHEPQQPPEEETFPQQLMKIIESESTSGVTRDAKGERVLEWLPSGKAFVIRDKNLFEAEILPRHFSSRCKFMSFVRKLYRWGFRQVGKDTPGLMIFMNGNFVRGEMRRCLLMRSIVKKHPNHNQQHHQQQAYGHHGMAIIGGQFPPFGPSPGAQQQQLQRFVSDASNFARESEMQVASEMMMMTAYPPPTPLNTLCGDNNNAMTNSHRNINNFNSNGMGMGGGASSSLFPPYSSSFGSGGRRFSPSSAMAMMPGCGGNGNNNDDDSQITSKDMFEAAMRLERAERQRLQQSSGGSVLRMTATMTATQLPPIPPPMGMYDTGMNASTASGLPLLGLQSLTTAATAPPMNNNNANYEIELASKMMKRDPSLEPRKALELAKLFNKN